jgi:hypothetical protein
MDVGTLPRILAMRWRSLDDLNLKLDRKFLRRITGSLVASLVPELSPNHVLGGNHFGKWTYFHHHRELP